MYVLVERKVMKGLKTWIPWVPSSFLRDVVAFQACLIGSYYCKAQHSQRRARIRHTGNLEVARTELWEL